MVVKAANNAPLGHPVGAQHVLQPTRDIAEGGPAGESAHTTAGLQQLAFSSSWWSRAINAALGQPVAVEHLPSVARTIV
jgi:hypothetical protein